MVDSEFLNKWNDTWGFQIPKISKRERLVRNHGYYEGTIRDGVRSLTPTIEEFKKLCWFNPNATEDDIINCYIWMRHDFDIFSEKDESFKDWMLRLGWLVRDADGHIVEA